MSATKQPRYKLTGSAVGLFFFGTIPPALLGWFSWYVYPMFLWMLLTPFAALWLVLCMIGFVRALKVDTRHQTEVDNFEKLKPLIDSGHQLVYESHVILDDTDRKALDRAFRRPIVGYIIFLMVPVVLSWLISPWLLLICLVPIGIAGASWWSVSVMKKRNRKVILRGIVTRRPFHRDRQNNDHYHFLMVGDKQFSVEPSFYEQYIIGDIIELHYVGWIRGNKVSMTGAVFTQHRKLSPEEYSNWVKENIS